MLTDLGLHQLRLALARRRVLLAAGLAAASVAAGLSAVAPPAVAGTSVVAAAREVPAGTRLRTADLTTVELPAGASPAGTADSVSALVGRVVVTPVRRGEPLTDARLLGPSQLDIDEVAAPVRVAEPAVPLLVRAGDRIDVLAASPQGGERAAVVASRVRVLALPTADAPSADGALVVVATSRSVAARLAAAAVTSRLSVLVLPG